jgi:hypothetical protein
MNEKNDSITSPDDLFRTDQLSDPVSNTNYAEPNTPTECISSDQSKTNEPVSVVKFEEQGSASVLSGGEILPSPKEIIPV